MARSARQQQANGLWHRADLMDMASDVLILGATLALAYAALLWAVRLPFFPLREVVLASRPAQVSVEQIEYAARRVVIGNFFTVDLDAVRQAFEKLPWVRRAQVRRQWPHGIELAIEEHEAAAVWEGRGGDPRLVNTYGEVFSGAANRGLPRLAGPEGTAAEVLGRFREFAAALVQVQRRPAAVALSSRLAWQLTLDDGLVIELGRDQSKAPAAQRLDRFVATYRDLTDRLPGPPAVADLRYPNGFTVRLRGEIPETKSKR